MFINFSCLHFIPFKGTKRIKLLNTPVVSKLLRRSLARGSATGQVFGNDTPTNNPSHWYLESGHVLVRPSVDPANMLRLHPVSQVLEPTRVCCGLIARALFMLWSGVGVKGGREDPKGRGEGGGIGGWRFYWGLIVFMLCRFSVVLLCVFFIISKTGILSFYF